MNSIIVLYGVIMLICGELEAFIERFNTLQECEKEFVDTLATTENAWIADYGLDWFSREYHTECFMNYYVYYDLRAITDQNIEAYCTSSTRTQSSGGGYESRNPMLFVTEQFQAFSYTDRNMVKCHCMVKHTPTNTIMHEIKFLLIKKEGEQSYFHTTKITYYPDPRKFYHITGYYQFTEEEERYFADKGQDFVVATKEMATPWLRGLDE